jgi:catechol 2,3-dioxygenase-like lactoylglutathione lyase family enzyme
MTRDGSQEQSTDGWVKGLNHISLQVRDLEEAKKFWIRIFDGKAHAVGKRVHVVVSGVALAFFDAPGLSGWEHEYPHYAFTVSSEGIRGLKRRLDESGVKTHPLWTRKHGEALMYFRDPTGNLFELYCPNYDLEAELVVAAGRGGDFVPPIRDLKYD